MSINRVAELAKVSVSTVSRVMNNQPRVAAATVKAVRDAMAALGYEVSQRRPGPKPIQRARNELNIAFLVFGAESNRPSPSLEALLFGVSMAASEANANLLFGYVPHSEGLPDRFTESWVNGVLLHGAVPSPAAQRQLKKSRAVWLLGDPQRSAIGDNILPDAYTAGELAAQYLFEKGHKKWAYFSTTADDWSAKIHKHAFEVVAAEKGASVAVLESERAAPSKNASTISVAADRLVARYLKLPEQPTGLFIADTRLAAEVQPALEARGVRIGSSVDVVGCGPDLSALADLSPRPAFIDLRLKAIGKAGLSRLLWRLENAFAGEPACCMIEPALMLPSPPIKA